MTVRPVRGVSLGVVAALVAGLVLVPGSGASADSDDPSFHPVSADAVASAEVPAAVGAGAERVVTSRPSPAARARVTSSTQVLQTWTGMQGAGQQGVSVAAGPKQVVQTVSDGGQGAIRGHVKATGVRPKGGNKTLLQFFGLGNPTTVSQASAVYDPVGKRFIVVAVADEGGDVGLVMRISKGTSATPFTNKRWRTPVEFAFSTSADEEPGRGDVDESRPLLGVTSDKIVVTTEASDPDNTPSAIANRIFLLPKKEYFGGQEIGGWAASVGSTYDGQAPATNTTQQAGAFVAIPSDNVTPDGRGEVTVTTYTGPANTNTPPQFSKTVLFPEVPLVAPPAVPQAGGDTLDLGELAFTGVVWRSNTLYAATTVNAGGAAAVRVLAVRTGSGMSLAWDRTLQSATADWFAPDLAVDRGGNVIVSANDVGTAAGPSLAVFARRGSTWLSARFVAKGTDATGPGTSDWWNSTGAASDPTSPWDVWVSGVVGNIGVANGLSSSVARVSLAKNTASVKARSTRVRKGTRVTFTVKLGRPDSKNTIRGLPVALQRAPRSGGSFSTVKSGTTAANGTAQWRVKVKKATRYRTLGLSVTQQGGQGRAVAKVTSRPVTVRLR